MKKALALVLALVMVFSMGTMAFAEETTKTYACPDCDAKLYSDTELNAHMKSVHSKDPLSCPICGEKFYIESEYNKHIEICDVKANGSETIMADFTIKEILNMIVDLAKASMTQWGDIENIIITLIGFVEKITELGVNAVSEAEVKGAVADLEAALADVKLPKLDELLNGLKQKIKDLYAGEVATTVVVEETTVPAPSKDTGSSSVGIALFAAVSVAAAAAYVCTKKSK